MVSRRITTSFLLLSGLVFGSAQAAVFDGIAVASPGATGQVGSIGNGDDLTNAVEYYIPLDPNNAGDTYGVGLDCGGSGAGPDSGRSHGHCRQRRRAVLFQ